MVEKIGKTETEKWANEMLACRQIVAEIAKFGVTQNQILNIIKLLAMELEDRDSMLAISETIGTLLEKEQISTSIITTE